MKSSTSSGISLADMIKFAESRKELGMAKDLIFVMHTDIYESLKKESGIDGALCGIEFDYANYVPKDKVYMMQKIDWERMKPIIKENLRRIFEEAC